MTVSKLISIMILLLFVTPARAMDQLPKQEAGLWEITTKNYPSKFMPKLQYSDATTKYRTCIKEPLAPRFLRLANTDCSSLPLTKAGDKFMIETRCTKGVNAPNGYKIQIYIYGDFNNNITEDFYRSQDGDYSIYNKTTQIRIGDCNTQNN